MTSERELKLTVDDPAELRGRLRRAGARRRHQEAFEDNTLWDRGGALRAAGCVLRLRRDGRGARLTYKGAARFEGGLKIRPEHETAVDDPEAVERILTGLGYTPARRYQKRREEWELDGVVIAVDATPIGHFVEFEGPAAAAAAARCGYDPAEALAEDYLALYDAYRQSHPGAPADMLFAGAERGDG